MIKTLILPALSDNYIFLLYDEVTKDAAVVDPSEAGPVIEAIEAQGLSLKWILNTHHHWDHTGGNLKLKKKYGAVIVGYQGDARRIPGIDVMVDEGQELSFFGSAAQVFFIPGHTLGHIAYYFPKEQLLFCGDTLFLMGCGRLFEGTPEQMFTSLAKLKSLPDETKIYCAHEYTLDNARFARSVEPENETLEQREKDEQHIRAEGKPTIPALLSLEKQTNPFLRAATVEAFARLRKMKDHF